MNELLKDITNTEHLIAFLEARLDALNQLKTATQQRVKNLAYNLTIAGNILDKDCLRMADALAEYQEICDKISEIEEDLDIARADLENLQEILNDEN